MLTRPPTAGPIERYSRFASSGGVSDPAGRGTEHSPASRQQVKKRIGDDLDECDRKFAKFGVVSIAVQVTSVQKNVITPDILVPLTTSFSLRGKTLALDHSTSTPIRTFDCTPLAHGSFAEVDSTAIWRLTNACETMVLTTHRYYRSFTNGNASE